jgi:anti-sigma B factor antagonist
MKFTLSIQKNYTILALSGDVDMQYSPRAREQILKTLKKKEHMLIDLSEVTYIDSSGVASLVEGYQLAKTKQLEFGLIGVSNKAMQVLKLARLDRVFQIHQNLEERIQDSSS